MARLWNNFTTKMQDGTFVVPIVLLFLTGADFWSFIDLFIHGGQNPFLSLLIASIVAIAIDIVPYFLVIALITHIGSLRRTGAGEEASAVAKRRISWVVIVSASTATIVLLSWVTIMRLDVIDEAGRASFARFEAAEAEGRVVNSNNLRAEELTGGTIIGNTGFIQHWHIAGTEPMTDDFGNEVFNAAGDVQMQYKEVYGYYSGFHVHRILLISAWMTTFVSMFLSAFYFKAYWWHATLERITNMSGETARLAEIRRAERERREAMRAERERERDERHRRKSAEREERRQRRTAEREARNDLRRLERDEKKRLKALRAEIKRKISAAYAEMKEEQKRANQEMDEGQREMKKAQNEARLKRSILPPTKPKMKKLKEEMERARIEEEAAAATCERERAERDKARAARIHLMTELWEDLHCYGEMLDGVEEFTAMCHKEILMRELLSIEANYAANLQELYGGIKADLQGYVAEMANMAADEVMASRINEIDVDEIISSHNANRDLAAEGLHLRQWNTQQSRDALLAGYREMMGLQDINLAG